MTIDLHTVSSSSCSVHVPAALHGHALFGRLAPALRAPVPQADEWALTADDPRRCQRCQSAPCGCHGTDAAQARASLPDRVVLDVWVKR